MKIKLLKEWKPEDSDSTFAAGTILDVPKEEAARLFADEMADPYRVEAQKAAEPSPRVDIAKTVEKTVRQIIEATPAATPEPKIAKARGDVQPHVEVGEPEILKSKTFGFRSSGEFALCVADVAINGRLDERLATLKGFTKAPTGMSQLINTDGGYLVPPQFSDMIWDGMNKATDNLVGRADRYTVTGESLTFPANAETSRATGSRWGGARAYRISEAAQITSSKPTFREVKIAPKQTACLIYATDKLLRNAPALEAYISRAATSEIEFLSNDEVVNGVGGGQMLGLLASPSLVTVSKETGQAAATIVTANILKMWARLHPRSKANAVWLVNQEVPKELLQLNIAVGTGGSLVYMPPGGLSGAPYGTLFGRPVLETEYCAALGTVGDIILWDPTAYCYGTSGSVESAVSMHLRFDYAESVFRFMYADDGQPWLASAITPYKGTSGATLSTHVALATRA